MKRKLLAIAFIVVIGISASGCATYLPYGGLYTEVKAPLSVADTDVKYSKTGTAMATSVLGLVATGDASLKAAMDNGGITKVKYVEYSVRNILGVYGEYTVTVYGD